ncbi:aldo/keto reductase [Nesterenkonia alkaliphila]|uniref:Aldo/keto reductase n=1 Tax=Nesterenkonia alkaliphila TaxID=1463631 RepID=A0A7K1UL66_9MICC|nr:aldo/keto reductase [Nesterenkonia alkaliphila]MVT27237.1 aldo/keto reductase [Nesterenkonia alkaliphila]GFZ78379.1 oxidoreductase [Nesterenkonia alkaliphila]
MTLRTVDLGSRGSVLTTTALGYGAMSIAGAYGPIDEQGALNLLHEIYDRGVTFIDTANIYGLGLSESILGKFLAGRRAEFTLATKCGIEPKGEAGQRGTNGRPEHIREQIDLSLSRLGTDYVDLYYLHRPDPQVPVEESVGALADLVTAGKVRTIGLSEHTAEEIRRGHAVHPITAVQSEWSIFARDVERYVIPTCAELGIGFVPYSPVARGLLTDRFSPELLAQKDTRHKFPWFFPENLGHNNDVAAHARELAAEAGLPTAGLALAWLYAKASAFGVKISVIPGTRYAQNLDELLTGLEAGLAAEAISALDELADQMCGDRSFSPTWVSGGREGLLPRS